MYLNSVVLHRIHRILKKLGERLLNRIEIQRDLHTWCMLGINIINSAMNVLLLYSGAVEF